MLEQLPYIISKQIFEIVLISCSSSNLCLCLDRSFSKLVLTLDCLLHGFGLNLRSLSFGMEFLTLDVLLLGSGYFRGGLFLGESNLLSGGILISNLFGSDSLLGCNLFGLDVFLGSASLFLF